MDDLLADAGLEAKKREDLDEIRAPLKSNLAKVMFNPFFTTKPTGEGTVLGLSMSHDIVVKQHGGKIDFETKAGEFTEFIITLPRDYGTPRGPKQE